MAERTRAATRTNGDNGETFDPLVDRDKIPAIDETVPGGVFRDAQGYHDANGNRLTDEEGEARLARQQEIAMEHRSPVEIAAAARETSAPARVENGLLGTEGDPSNLADPLGKEENAPPEVDESDVSTGAGGENPGNRAGAGTGAARTGRTPTGRTEGAGATRTVSGKTADELESMTKDELVTLADRRGITVERGDGNEGEPRKEDYVKALSKRAS